jgi:UDPglucose 6-dehydrogenase
MYDACKGCDCLVIVTDWNEFKMPNWEKLKDLMKTPLLFDGRNLYPPKKMKELGFEYYGLGRKKI